MTGGGANEPPAPSFTVVTLLPLRPVFLTLLEVRTRVLMVAFRALTRFETSFDPTSMKLNDLDGVLETQSEYLVWITL